MVDVEVGVWVLFYALGTAVTSVTCVDISMDVHKIEIPIGASPVVVEPRTIHMVTFTRLMHVFY